MVLFGFCSCWAQNTINLKTIAIGDSVIKSSYGSCIFQNQIEYDTTYSISTESKSTLFYSLFESDTSDSNPVTIMLVIDSSFALLNNDNDYPHGLIFPPITACNLYKLDSAITRTAARKNQKKYAEYEWQNTSKENYFGTLVIKVSSLNGHKHWSRGQVVHYTYYHAITGTFISTKKYYRGRINVTF
jgi:hypothetical protein